MKKETAQKIAALLVPGALLFSLALPAFAEDAAVNVNLNANTTTTMPGKRPLLGAPIKANENAQLNANAKARLSTKTIGNVERAGKEIETRVKSLTELSARVNGMAHVSAATKAALSASVQNNLNN